jgi:DnaK suppressor protein
MSRHPKEVREPLRDWEIQRFRNLLEAHRETAQAALERLGDETRKPEVDEPQDMADRSTNSVTRESLFQLGSARRRWLGMVERALARIQQGTFGVCAGCGEEINSRRLEALPWTQYCLSCQRDLEHEQNVRHDRELDPQSKFRKAG